MKLDPDSEVGKVAAQLLPVMASLSQSEADCAAVLGELTTRVVSADPQVLTFAITFAAKDGEAVRMQFQFEGTRFRTVAGKGNDHAPASRAARKAVSFFTSEEAAVLELVGRQYQMAFGYQFVETPAGLARNLSTNLIGVSTDLRTVLRTFLDSPALAKRRLANSAAPATCGRNLCGPGGSHQHGANSAMADRGPAATEDQRNSVQVHRRRRSPRNRDRGDSRPGDSVGKAR